MRAHTISACLSGWTFLSQGQPVYEDLEIKPPSPCRLVGKRHNFAIAQLASTTPTTTAQ
jgi:hypothetical protein